MLGIEVHDPVQPLDAPPALVGNLDAIEILPEEAEIDHPPRLASAGSSGRSPVLAPRGSGDRGALLVREVVLGTKADDRLGVGACLRTSVDRSDHQSIS